MESKNDESDLGDGRNEVLDGNTMLQRVRLLPTSVTCAGGVIQPLSPRFSGSEVFNDHENEDHDVQWISAPDLGAVLIANVEATPLSYEDIAAINVLPERITSSDDERPASSYPLLDRRHHRQDPSSMLDQISPIPLAIGSIIDEDEEIHVFNEWEAMTTVTATV